jgi:histone H2A
MVGNRVGSHSAIYMAAVLEYLTAELLEGAGNLARHMKKVRIVPSMIK